MSINFYSSLSAENRILSTKNHIKTLRKSGSVPGVIYLKNSTCLNISVNLVSFQKLINDPSCFTRIFELKVNDKNIFCLLKDVQFDVMLDIPSHFDFMEITKNDIVKIKVPVKIINKDKCPGVRTGGDVYVLSYNTTIKCPIEHIPASLDIDVATSQIGTKFRLSDITLPKGCSMINNVVLARVTGKRVIKEAVAGETSTVTQEEVKG